MGSKQTKSNDEKAGESLIDDTTGIHTDVHEKAEVKDRGGGLHFTLVCSTVKPYRYKIDIERSPSYKTSFHVMSGEIETEIKKMFNEILEKTKCVNTYRKVIIHDLCDVYKDGIKATYGQLIRENVCKAKVTIYFYAFRNSPTTLRCRIVKVELFSER